MKKQVTIFIIFSLLITVGATISSKIESVSYANQNIKSPIYCNAISENGIIKIDVTLDSKNEFYEIARDIVASEDENFTNTLSIKALKANDSTYSYYFESEKLLEDIYIKPPILYSPKNINKIELSLQKSKEVSILSDDHWFKIDDVQLSDGEKNATIKIIISAKSDKLPRYPKLLLDDTYYDGLSSLNFDSNDNFTFGEFYFNIPTKKEKISTEINNATLIVEHALVKVHNATPIEKIQLNAVK